MDDVKIGEILLPGDEATQNRREAQVRRRFWPTLRKAARYVPFSRDLVAAFYCAIDPKTPARAKGVLLAALGYFVLPIDVIPDFLVVAGFTDDVAVLAAALKMISAHITDEHYQAAELALADQPDIAASAQAQSR
ncbi:YkvA family protein [Neorhizobium sp. NPDC001467]|uniref:YkvA family protein n=1 Tax=Neorhizobium sp. NPDC001467 TaxID=3390595 RepID=UPI003CFF78A8